MMMRDFARAIARSTAAHRKAVGGGVVCAVIFGITLFTAHARMTPAGAVAKGPINGAPAQSADTTGAAASTGTVSATFQGWLRAPVAPVSRNLFYINLEQFPRAKGGPASVPAPAAGASEREGILQENPAQQAKSPGGPSEESEEPESEMSAADRVARQAGRLHLQSVLMGTTPRAMIDGQLLAEGDVVANFRVLKIEARGITVEREGIKLEVLFKSDLSR
jgi:hypothetical protein